MDSNENINDLNHLIELSNSDYEIKDGEPDIEGWDVKNEDGQKIGEVEDLLFDPQTNKVRYIIVDLDNNELELDEDKKVLIPIGIAKIYEDNGDEVDAGDDDGFTIDNGTNPYHFDDPKDAEPTHEVVIDTETGIEKNPVADETVYGDDYNNEDGIYNAAYDGDVVIVPASILQLRELPAYDHDNISPEVELTTRRIFTPDSTSTEIVPYDRKNFYEHEHFINDRYDRGATMDSIVPDEDDH